MAQGLRQGLVGYVEVIAAILASCGCRTEYARDTDSHQAGRIAHPLCWNHHSLPPHWRSRGPYYFGPTMSTDVPFRKILLWVGTELQRCVRRIVPSASFSACTGRDVVVAGTNPLTSPV